MKICLLGYDNLPVLTPKFRDRNMGGESVQQTLLARALVRRGHDVSMVTLDHGQPDGVQWDGIRVYKAYRPRAGVPVLRFVHPRWTGTWSALERADADLYYTSCAGMHVGLLALFCQRLRRRFVYRTASDADCDPRRVGLFVRYARDRWLYAYGLRRADAILVQSGSQARSMARNYGLAGRVAGMLVDPSPSVCTRDIDVLWVGNLKRVKRPDRLLDLAATLPHRTFHVVGGETFGEEDLYRTFSAAASSHRNIVFHGRLPYGETNALYDRARLLVSTSEMEGFPNVYLQAWVRGVPVVTLIDPDGVIARERLGIAVRDPAALPRAISSLLDQPREWSSASARCRAYMDREYGEDRVLAAYLAAFEDVLCGDATNSRPLAPREYHV